MRRLFSTFAHGWPGAGLFIMRLAAGATLIASGMGELLHGPSPALAALNALAMIAGILLILGLWTPMAGSLTAIIQVWSLLSQPSDPWTKILLMALGFGLAMTGPGAWSIDARLFGWKRLNF